MSSMIKSLTTLVFLGFCVVPIGSAHAGGWTGTLLVSDVPGTHAQHPYLTSDGSKLVMSYYTSGSRNIWTILSDGSGLTQVTSYPAVTNGDERPIVSDDGSKIVFESNADPLGTNADGNKEIFTVNSNGTGLTQVTVTTTVGGGAFHASISGDGTKICFNFFGANLTGGNPDLNTEVYTANFNGSGMVQVTNTTGGGGAFGMITGDGSAVIWSDGGFGLNSIRRTNPDGTGTVVLATLQNAFVLPRHAVSDSVSLVVFTSNDNPFGTNPDGNKEIFTVNAGGVVTQVTQTTDNGGLGNANLRPYLSGDGSRIVFITQNDITGQNPDFGAEVFIVSPSGTGLAQITNSTVAVPTNADWSYISVDASGSSLAVVTGHDFDGGNHGAFSLWILTNTGGPTFVRGDCNVDGLFNIADGVFGLGVLFSGIPALCADACDANDDGSFDVADVIYTLAAIFTGGPPPPTPHPGCGSDATSGDPLGCAFFAPCP